MIGFELLLGHLVGDYIVQNDWMAKWKTVWGRDVFKLWSNIDYIESDGIQYPKGTSVYHNMRLDEYIKEKCNTNRGHLSCSIHCLLYTLSVWLFTFAWMPWWGLFLCFLVHWPVDRFRLAALWMKNVSGQSFFASKEHPMFPWSIVMVDNIFHLVTLYLIRIGFVYFTT